MLAIERKRRVCIFKQDPLNIDGIVVTFDQSKRLLCHKSDWHGLGQSHAQQFQQIMLKSDTQYDFDN